VLSVVKEVQMDLIYEEETFAIRGAVFEVYREMVERLTARY